MTNLIHIVNFVFVILSIKWSIIYENNKQKNWCIYFIQLLLLFLELIRHTYWEWLFLLFNLFYFISRQGLVLGSFNLGGTAVLHMFSFRLAGVSFCSRGDSIYITQPTFWVFNIGFIDSQAFVFVVKFSRKLYHNIWQKVLVV